MESLTHAKFLVGTRTMYLISNRILLQTNSGGFEVWVKEAIYSNQVNLNNPWQRVNLEETNRSSSSNEWEEEEECSLGGNCNANNGDNLAVIDETITDIIIRDTPNARTCINDVMLVENNSTPAIPRTITMPQNETVPNILADIEL